MALRSELVELLSGFEKRMKFINIVRCLLEYRYPDAIRAMVPDKKVLDNVVLAVLVYMKERTLGEEKRCTLADVERFLGDFSEAVPGGERIDPRALARYIVVDVLQNGGVLTEFPTYHGGRGFRPMPVRLLNEEKGGYHLTDDAFDFLFRSKEIESELDYSVTRFRMKEYMKRDNYGEALDASRELVSRIRGMKTAADDFLLRCREDLSRITVDQYEAVVSRIRSLLEDEYRELTEIRESARERMGALEAARRSGVGEEETRRHRLALAEIIRNISLTIEEQRALINKKSALSESYQELIRDHFAADAYARLNFEKDLLAPLRRPGAPLADAAKFLLFPLAAPGFEKQFSVENFYAPQTDLCGREEAQGLDLAEEGGEDPGRRAEERNGRFLAIVRSFFAYARGRARFPASGFVGSLSGGELRAYCEENALPNVLLSLFALQELDIEGWRAEGGGGFAFPPSGEFELSRCLEGLPEGLLEARRIRFEKAGGTFRFEAPPGPRRIDMTDFEVEVVR